MKPDKNINPDKILESINGVKRMKAPDFFYTRLRARMERSTPSSPRYKELLRPAYVIAFLALIITFNLISVLRQDKGAQNNISASENENSQTIASAYHLDDNLTYELNQ